MQNSVFFYRKCTQSSQFAAYLLNVEFKYKNWVLVAQSERENIKINEAVNKMS